MLLEDIEARAVLDVIDSDGGVFTDAQFTVRTPTHYKRVLWNEDGSILILSLRGGAGINYTRIEEHTTVQQFREAYGVNET